MFKKNWTEPWPTSLLLFDYSFVKKIDKNKITNKKRLQICYFYKRIIEISFNLFYTTLKVKFLSNNITLLKKKIRMMN